MNVRDGKPDYINSCVFMRIVTPWCTRGLPWLYLAFSINFILMWRAKSLFPLPVMACACEVSEFGLTRWPNPPSCLRTSSHPVVIQLELMDQVLERVNTMGRVFEGPARCGEKDLVSILSSETHFSALLSVHCVLLCWRKDTCGGLQSLLEARLKMRCPVGHMGPSTVAPCLLSVPSSGYLASSPCSLGCCLQGAPWKVPCAPFSFLDSMNDLHPFYVCLTLLRDRKALEHD